MSYNNLQHQLDILAAQECETADNILRCSIIERLDNCNSQIETDIDNEINKLIKQMDALSSKEILKSMKRITKKTSKIKLISLDNLIKYRNDIK